MTLFFCSSAAAWTALGSDGEWPSEFFYGYMEIKNAGALVDLLDETAFGFGERTLPVWTVLTLISSVLFSMNAWAAHRLAGGLNRLSIARTVVAVNNASGVALANLMARCRLRPEVVFIAMGLVWVVPRPLVHWVYACILRHVTHAVILRAEREFRTGLIG